MPTLTTRRVAHTDLAAETLAIMFEALGNTITDIDRATLAVEVIPALLTRQQDRIGVTIVVSTLDYQAGVAVTIGREHTHSIPCGEYETTRYVIKAIELDGYYEVTLRTL